LHLILTLVVFRQHWFSNTQLTSILSTTAITKISTDSFLDRIASTTYVDAVYSLPSE